MLALPCHRRAPPQAPHPQGVATAELARFWLPRTMSPFYRGPMLHKPFSGFSTCVCNNRSVVLDEVA